MIEAPPDEQPEPHIWDEFVIGTMTSIRGLTVVLDPERIMDLPARAGTAIARLLAEGHRVSVPRPAEDEEGMTDAR